MKQRRSPQKQTKGISSSTRNSFEQIFSWDEDGIKRGKSFQEIILAMRKAAGENLMKDPPYAGSY